MISDRHDRERPLPGEHFVPVSDGLECFGRILDAEAGGVVPTFLHRFCSHDSGDFGVGVWAPQNGRPRGMLGASCAAGGFGCAAWHFPDNSE